MSPGPTPTYDREQVLDTVMQVFWRNGYRATSVRELRDATGLGSRTLYADFGNKQTLLGAALDRYRLHAILPLYEPLERGDSRVAALHCLIDRFESMAPDDRRRGCLVGLGMADAGEIDDDEVADQIASLAEEMRDRLAATITAGIEDGEIDPTVSAPDTAALLTTALQGIHLTARLQPDGPLRADALAGAHRLVDDISRPHRTGSTQ